MIDEEFMNIPTPKPLNITYKTETRVDKIAATLLPVFIKQGFNAEASATKAYEYAYEFIKKGDV